MPEAINKTSDHHSEDDNQHYVVAYRIDIFINKNPDRSGNQQDAEVQ